MLNNQFSIKEAKTVLITQAEKITEKLNAVQNITELNFLINEFPNMKTLLLGGVIPLNNNQEVFQLPLKLIIANFMVFLRLRDSLNIITIVENNNKLCAWLSNKIGDTNDLPSPNVNILQEILQWYLQANLSQNDLNGAILIKKLFTNTDFRPLLSPNSLPFQSAIHLFDLLLTKENSNEANILWSLHSELRSWHLGEPRGIIFAKESEMVDLFIKMLETHNPKLLTHYWRNNILLHRAILTNYFEIIQTIIIHTTNKNISFFSDFLKDVRDEAVLNEIIKWLDNDPSRKIARKKINCKNLIESRLQELHPVSTQCDNANNNNQTGMTERDPALNPPQISKEILDQIEILRVGNKKRLPLFISENPFIMHCLAGNPVMTSYSPGSLPVYGKISPEMSRIYLNIFIEMKAIGLITKFWGLASIEVKQYLSGTQINDKSISRESAFRLFYSCILLNEKDISIYLYNHHKTIINHILELSTAQEASHIFIWTVYQRLTNLTNMMWIQHKSLRESIFSTLPLGTLPQFDTILKIQEQLKLMGLHKIAEAFETQFIAIKIFKSPRLILPKLVELKQHRHFYLTDEVRLELQKIISPEILFSSVQFELQTCNRKCAIKVTILDTEQYAELVNLVIQAQIRSRFSETFEMIDNLTMDTIADDHLLSETAIVNPSFNETSTENEFIPVPEDLLEALSTCVPTNLEETNSSFTAPQISSVEDDKLDRNQSERVSSSTQMKSPPLTTLYGFNYGYHSQSFPAQPESNTVEVVDEEPLAKRTKPNPSNSRF